MFDGIKSSLREHYVAAIEKQIDGEIGQMQKIISAANFFNNLPSNEQCAHAKIADYKAQLHSLINDTWSDPEEKKFTEAYNELTEAIQSNIDSLNEKQVREQKRERFQVLSEDSFSIVFQKAIKRSFFELSIMPRGFANLFRKQKLESRYWKHTIPLQNLARRQFQEKMILDLKEVTNHFFRGLSAKYSEIKLWEETLGQTKNGTINKGLKDFKKDLLTQINDTLDHIVETRSEIFLSEREKAGTIEFPNHQLTDRSIARSIDQSEKDWTRNNLEWKNNIYALFEEWRYDLDINTLKHKTLAELEEFQIGQIDRLGEHINPEINEIREFIKEANQTLSKSGESLPKELKKINYQAGKKLDKELVPKLCDKLSGKLVTNLIDKLEIVVCRNVELLSDEHVIVKKSTYDEPLKTEELYKISPYELIAFEMLTALQEKLSTAKKELFSSLETTTANATDLDHIVTFSLSSAISASEEGKSNEEALSIAKEGLERASNRLAETKEQLDASILKNSELLTVGVNQFCSDIMELTENENVRQLRLRITKAKAAKQADEVRKQLSEKVQNRRVWLYSASTHAKDQIVHFVDQVGEKFILTASKPAISKQVSDFLIESQLAIDKLPLIYQKLYQIEPLEDLELFEGRKQEFEELKGAFENWKKGRFAATAILGEKWGGLSTFLNYVIKEAKFKYPVKRFTIAESINTQEEFLELMKKVLKDESLENFGQLIDTLNSGQQRVIILEDIQNLYLRKVNGFGAIEAVLQLITSTSQNVFWVVTTTIYTWEYLNKTINIQEFFSYNIRLGKFSDEQIVNIIWKRNKISGFDILFEASNKLIEDRKFKALAESEQQQLLKKRFFSDLNAFAESNVSMALLFWLLSTKKVDQSTITIGTFIKPDLNFLTVLSMDKIYVLHALILHDGLTETQLSEVLNISQTTSRMALLALFEDGIIFKKEVFMVNPIVYRNTIGLLKNRNLIH